MKTFGEISDGKLFLNLSNVQEAMYYNITRKTDFTNDLSEKILLMERRPLIAGKNKGALFFRLQSLLFQSLEDTIALAFQGEIVGFRKNAP